MASIGFVGLGHMGLPMANNLIKAGHKVTGYDLLDFAKEQLEQFGGIAASSLKETAFNQDVLITMLQTGDQVLHVCQGTQGLFHNAKDDALYIDCSTIDVASARLVHKLAEARGLVALDAPVSGGVAGAVAKTLTFMVGGDEIAYSKAHPILSAMGQKIIHAGIAGNGQAAKICNNMILGISMIAVSEAFILGQQLGLNPNKLFEVVSNSSGQCWSMTKYVPVPGILDNVPANHEYQPGFAATMMLKDLVLSQNAAQSAQVTTPLGALATQLYQELINEGQGNMDFSAIIQLISKHSQLS